MILALLLHLFAAHHYPAPGVVTLEYSTPINLVTAAMAQAPATFTFPIPVPTGCTAAVVGSNIMITCPIPMVTPPPPPPPALSITTPISLPSAQVQQPYSIDLSKLAVPTGGVPPYTFKAVSGFPAWLSLSSTGMLTGTPAPTDVGNFTLSFSVTDSSGSTKMMLGTGNSFNPWVAVMTSSK